MTTIYKLSTGNVAVAEFGDPDGEPTFFFHGWPSSRTQARLAHVAAQNAGIRLISPDRPGIGQSTFQSGRRLLDWPSLLGELADHMEIPHFRILAVSGGGPYALVSCWALPDRVKAAAVVCGAPPLAETSPGTELSVVYRWLLAAHRIRPTFVHGLFHIARPFFRRRAPLWTRPWMLKALPLDDAEVLRDEQVFDICYSNFREAWDESAAGVIRDAEVYAAPWGFPVEEVRVPVRLWHGKSDQNFSWSLAEALGKRIPDCTSRFIEGEGHYSLPIRRVREILEDLRAARETAGERENVQLSTSNVQSGNGVQP